MNTRANKSISIDKNTLLSRQEACEILHIGLSSLDSLETYKSIPRVKLGRHTFFIKDDILEFILAHTSTENRK